MLLALLIVNALNFHELLDLMLKDAQFLHANVLAENVQRVLNSV